MGEADLLRLIVPHHFIIHVPLTGFEPACHLLTKFFENFVYTVPPQRLGAGFVLTKRQKTRKTLTLLSAVRHLRYLP